jgi:hypothetical protein
MKHFVMEGTPLQAKQAAIVLVNVKSMVVACQDVHDVRLTLNLCCSCFLA